MKKQALLILLIFSVAFAKAQAPCDIATGGLEVRNAANTTNISTIAIGQTANYRFDIYNAGTSPGCTIPANTVEAIFDFSGTAAGPVVYNGPASFSSGHFTWTYSAIDKALIGTNTTPITQFDGDAGVLIPVRGTATGTNASSLNITQNGGVTDNVANNTGNASLVVAGVVPVRFNDLAAEGGDCSAKLRWSTSMEETTTTFDVEFSPDGRNYIKVATVASKGNVHGSQYEYAYTQGNGKGYYRLKMGNADGGYSYSKVVTTDIKCNVKKVFIYPNPVQEHHDLNVNVSNYQGAVKGQLLSGQGQVVLTTKLLNGPNVVKLTNLPQGTYTFKVTDDAGEMQTYKVVIIK